MSDQRKDPMKRLLAGVLTAALVLLSPGLPCYEALAGEFNAGEGAPAEQPAITPSIPGSQGVGSVPSLSVPDLNLPVTPSVPAAAESGAAAQPETPSAVLPAAQPRAQTAGPEASAQTPLAESQPEAPSEAEPAQPGAQPASTAQTPAAGAAESAPGAASRRELAKALSSSKTDKAGVLGWLFDRIKRRSGIPGVVAAAEPAARAAGLAPAVRSLGGVAPATVPAPAAETAPRPGRWQRLKSAMSLREYNASEKSYIKGQIVFLMALSIYVTSLPLLVNALTGNPDMTGQARTFHYWTLAFASLFAGKIVQKLGMLKVLRGGSLIRAVAFGAIGGLALLNLLPWPVFIGLVMLNAVVVAHTTLTDMDEGGPGAVMDSEHKIEKSGYLYDTIFNAAMMIVPPLVGLGMDGIDRLLGAGIGPKLAYVAFSMVMLAATRYYEKVRVVRDESRKALLSFWRTVKLIAHNAAIRTRWLMATLENFIEDALFSVVLPVYAIEVLHQNGLGNGLLLSGKMAGGLLAGAAMTRFAVPIQKKIGTYNFLVALTVMASLAFVPTIGLWVHPTLWLAVPTAMLMKILYQPIRSRMRALLQVAIRNDPLAKDHPTEVFSLMNFTGLLAAGAGGLAFEFLFEQAKPGHALYALAGPLAPMKALTVFLASLSVVYLIGLRWMKQQLTSPTEKVYESGGKEAAGLEKLSANLKRMGLPPYATKTVEQAVSADRPTVAILAPASVYKLSIAREGARQSQGDVHLVLDPSWLIQETYPDGKTKLLLKKGLTFEGDQAVVVEYKTPRPVHYFANFFTLGANDRDDGVPLEKNLDAPMSNSVQLEKVTNDKLLTRLLLAAKGVAVPATVAFLMAAHPLRAKAAELGGSGLGVHVAAMPEGPAAREEIKAGIEDFLKHFTGPEVVVKPSGPQFHSGRGVEFFRRDQVDAMVEHVLALQKDAQMTSDGAVLIDGRLQPPALYLRAKDGPDTGRTAALLGQMVPLHVLRKDELSTASPKEKKDWNIRVLAARTPWGGGATTGMFVRAGAWGVPTSALPDTVSAEDLSRVLAEDGIPVSDELSQRLKALGARPQIVDVIAALREADAISAEAADAVASHLRLPDAAAVVAMDDVVAALREQYGLLATDDQAQAFLAELKKMGADAVAALAANEAQRVRAEGEPLQAQTDYLGLDVMVELENGRLVPKIIEVNDHDAGGQFELDKFDPENAGAHSREWVATMLERARLDALRGKRIAIIGAGYSGKRFVFERAKELGVDIVLVDKRPSAFKRFLGKLLKPFGYKVQDHWAADLVSEFVNVDNTDHEHAFARAQKKLLRSARKNGKIDGIATFWEDDVPLTAELARALKVPYHTVDAADAVRSKFKTRELMRKAGLPTPRYQMIKTPQDLEAAIKTVGFPAVIKPVYGAEAMGVVRVNDADEAREAYQAISKQLTPELDDIFVYGSEMVMEQYLDGREWDADIVMQDGQAAFVSVTDNWPTREPHFVATGSSLPSRALSKKEQADVQALAVKTAQALGLRDGVIHVEGKTTAEGPRIVEANGRMGGVYVRDWVKAVWGVDLVDQQLLLAAGIPVGVYKPAQPLTHLEGEFVIHDENGVLSRQDMTDEGRAHPGFHNLRHLKKQGDRVEVPFHARTAMLEAKGATSEEAQRHLNQLRAQLILDVKTDSK